MDYNFTFNSRDTYVAYRADWRARYKELTLEIRDLKKQHLAQQRAGTGGFAGYNLRQARREANELMKERTAATEFKNQQMAQAVAEAA